MDDNAKPETVKRQTASCPMCGEVVDVLTGKKTVGNLRSHKDSDGKKCVFRSAKNLPEDWFQK